MKVSRDRFYSANELFLSVFGHFFLNIINVEAFHRTTKTALNFGKARVYREYRDGMKTAAALPELQEIFETNEFVKSARFSKALGNALAQRSVRVADETIDAATLVFAHTMLDEVLSDCCRIAFLAKPDDWHGFVKKRKLEAGLLNASTGEKIIEDLCWDFVCQRQRESMVRRLQILNQTCAPHLRNQRIPTAWIKKDALGEFDCLRHNIIHGKPFSTKVRAIEDRVYFAKMVGLSVLSLVSRAHDLMVRATPQRMSIRAGLRLCAILRREFPEFEDFLRHEGKVQQVQRSVRRRSR
jgi:hypothetical protein